MVEMMPKVLLLPPLMLALLVLGAPIEEGDIWRVDQLTRQGVQKTLTVEREGESITATLADGTGDQVFATMDVVDIEKGRISYKVGGVGDAKKVDFSRLIKDFDREALRTATALAIELQNGEKASFHRSADVVYLSAPGQGVTFAARKVE